MTDSMLPRLTLERDEASAEFFDAAAAEKISLRRCTGCDTYYAAEFPSCRACGAIDATTAHAAGTATLVTWTVVERAPHPAFADVVPYLVGIIELSEGPWMCGRLLFIPERPRPGMALRAEFRRSHDGEAYPIFVPAGQQSE
jgi:uncharacterized OB-fold protein